MARLRTGSNKLESSCVMLNDEYSERETTHTQLQSKLDVKGDIMAVDIRSHGKRELGLKGQTTGGEPR